MLNKVFLMGRLVADPEARQTPGGTPVTTFRIAVDRNIKNKQTGERDTDFFTVVAWSYTADFVAKYFTKGRMAVVEGRLQVRNYTDRDGNKRYVTEVVADNVFFGDSRRDSDSGGSYGGGAGRSTAAAPAEPSRPAYDVPTGDMDQFSELDDDNEKLPF